MIGSAIMIDLAYQCFIAVPIVVGIFSALCFFEFCAMASLRGFKIPYLLPMLVLPVSCFFYPIELVFLGFLIIGVIARFMNWQAAAVCLAGFFYCGLVRFAVWVTEIGEVKYNLAYYYIFMLACCKANDIFAYVVGKLFGRHKIWPRLSPMKTWEGTIAGLVAGTFGGVLCVKLSPLASSYPVPLPSLIFFCFAVTILGTAGDAVKSGIKRWAGVKDSGKLFGEMGGVLDVCDSFLISLPFTYLVLKLT
jgi:phosphatidate cytidylyltransferase